MCGFRNLQYRDKRATTGTTAQKVRSLSLRGYLGSDLSSGSVAGCCTCCCSIVPVLLMSFSGLAYCCHCCCSIVLVLSMSCSGLVIFCVDFPCYRVANSYNVSSLSRRCLVLITFHHIHFFRSLQERLSVLQ